MWAQYINAIIGLWIMVSPSVLHFNKTMSDNNHIVGPLIITFAVIAIWDINRGARWVNVITGAWLIVAIFLFSTGGTLPMLSNGLSGLAVIIFSLVRGSDSGGYGGGWASLFEENPAHLREANKQS